MGTIRLQDGAQMRGQLGMGRMEYTISITICLLALIDLVVISFAMIDMMDNVSFAVFSIFMLIIYVLIAFLSCKRAVRFAGDSRYGWLTIVPAIGFVAIIVMSVFQKLRSNDGLNDPPKRDRVTGDTVLATVIMSTFVILAISMRYVLHTS